MRVSFGAAVIAAFLVAGCSDLPSGPPFASQDKNVHVYVSNQSFDRPVVDLQVKIDGVVLFDDEADVDDQHNWMLREATFGAGTHTVYALERDSETEETMPFVLPEGGQRWLVVDFWYPNEAGQAEFSISVHEEQVFFD